MFKIIQSHRTENLVEELLKEYKSTQQAIFEPFVVIVPSMVLGDWLDKEIASRAGISTLVMTKFWGQYQWTLMQDVLSVHNNYLLSLDPNAQTFDVPEVAVLSPTVMQWRLFAYLTYYKQQIINDHTHPLAPLLSTLMVGSNAGNSNVTNSNLNRSNSSQPTESSTQIDARLWQLANDLARVFNRYLTHRDDWLIRWSNHQKLNVEQLIKEKDILTERFDKYASGTPDWLIDHYSELETAQRFLWTHLFADVHLHRLALEKQFWRALENNAANEIQQLPKVLRIFTIQQLPQSELNFLKRLSQYMDITLLHYNPSKLFWADIVDKSWLQRQKIINPQSVFLRDYGHSLLSRLGKQSRDTFAMLANLSGNEDSSQLRIEWQDKFDNSYLETSYLETSLDTSYSDTSSDSHTDETNYSKDGIQTSLLHKLQYDVLMLDEESTQQATALKVSKDIGQHIGSSFESEENPYDDDVLANKVYAKQRQWEISAYDNSLSIHSCHSLQRQLEVLRIMIGRWLNEPVQQTEKKRHLSDIVVLLPDVEQHHALINSIFVNGKGQDGLTLPAKVTGVVDAEIRQLWEAVIGFYKLLGSESARFESAEVLDWLMLPPLYENFGLTHEQMSRACDLLIESGFIRGFDEQHIKQTLDTNDFDYRFTFAHALDRLALGLIMPEAGLSDCLYPLCETEWSDAAVHEKTLPLSQISLDDAPIVETLCLIYSGLVERRDDYKKRLKAEDWLAQIENQVIHRYFSDVDQTRSMRAIYNAMNGFKSSLRANKHYSHYTNKASANKDIDQKLANVDKLPLKLSFMLESIEAELESQQVSAEPTGVITFGRFGALRNVPFKLVVMLNMNLSEFPGKDQGNRYDLMKATLSRRGDRVSEDDDNGAFLDALLCARDSCWIFYNGQSLTDNNEHLPANPVSELLQFLQGEVQWQINSVDNIPTTIDFDAENIKRQLPRLIKQWLVTEHPALPFHHSLFETEIETGSNLPTISNNDDFDSTDMSANNKGDNKNVLELLLDQAITKSKLAQQQQFPPAPIWQEVYKSIKSRAIDTKKQLVELPSKSQLQSLANLFDSELGKLGKLNVSDAEKLQNLFKFEQQGASTREMLANTIFNINEIDVEGELIYQVRHPAKTFLQAQEIHVVKGEASIDTQEPLFLNPLSAYQINDYLINKITDIQDRPDNSQPNEDYLQSSLLFEQIMPAGVSRQTVLPTYENKLQQQYKAFKEQLLNDETESKALNELFISEENNLLLTQTKEVPIEFNVKQLTTAKELTRHATSDSIEDIGKSSEEILSLFPNKIKMKGSVPVQSHYQSSSNNTATTYLEQTPRYWLNLSATSANPKHLLKFWLSHLYWQVARQTTSEQVALNDGVSIWRFSKAGSQINYYNNINTFKLLPIETSQASVELMKWAVFSHVIKQVPITLLPDYALNYLSLKIKTEQENKPYWPKRSDFSSWLDIPYGNDTIWDTCSIHPIWQYLLHEKDAFLALSDGLTTLAEPMYKPMYDALIKLES